MWECCCVPDTGCPRGLGAPSSALRSRLSCARACPLRPRPRCARQVSAEPEVRVFARNPVEDQFFVLACDGIWDVVKNEECVEFISKRLRMHGDLQKAAEDLLDHCLGLNSRDNMSVVLVQLGDLPPMDPALQREYAAEQQKKAQQQQQRAEAAGRPGGK